MPDLLTTEHPADTCPAPGHHCYWHNVDEPLEGYRWCFECRHMFVTAEELLAEHNKVLASLGMEAETDVGQVFCCPCCSHDW